MKNLLTYFRYRFLCTLISVLILFVPTHIGAFELFEDNDGVDVWELSFEENIKYPVIPVNCANVIRTNIKEQYLGLKQRGYDVKLVRNDEVIMITIPIDNLFNVNAYDKIIQNGEKYLKPLLPFFRIKEMYRIIFSVHHDNSLSNSEADYITNERVLVLSEWMVEKNDNAKNLIPYSMGLDYPVTNDKSKKGKKKNRRLEVFILPGKTMIDLAKDNKL